MISTLIKTNHTVTDELLIINTVIYQKYKVGNYKSGHQKLFTKKSGSTGQIYHFQMSLMSM